MTVEVAKSSLITCSVVVTGLDEVDIVVAHVDTDIGKRVVVTVDSVVVDTFRTAASVVVDDGTTAAKVVDSSSVSGTTSENVIASTAAFTSPSISSSFLVL